MEIYLDNSATTRVDPEVLALMKTVMNEDYGNAASLHKKGVEAEKYVRRAKEQIAETLKCAPQNIYFTSGGTESNNWAIRSAAEAYQRSGKHLITSSVEHPSVKNTMKYLSEQGYDVTWLPVDSDGLVSVESFDDCTGIRRAVPTNAVTSVSGPAQNNVSVTLFLSATYGSARFYKVFALDELPNDEE